MGYEPHYRDSDSIGKWIQYFYFLFSVADSWSRGDQETSANLDGRKSFLCLHAIWPSHPTRFERKHGVCLQRWDPVHHFLCSDINMISFLLSSVSLGLFGLMHWNSLTSPFDIVCNQLRIFFLWRINMILNNHLVLQYILNVEHWFLIVFPSRQVCI